MNAPLTLLFFLLSAAAFPLQPKTETEDTFNLKNYGITVYETGELYPPSEIERAVEENKVQCKGAADYAHRYGFSLAETVLLGSIGPKAASTLLGKYAGKLLGRQIGLKPRDSTTYPLRDRIEEAMSSLLRKNKPAQAGIYALLVKRPCPGGLRLAANQAITIAVADYNYAITQNVSRNDKDLSTARSKIKSALGKYKTYNGFADAEFLMFTDLAPGGFNLIISDSISAVEHTERAIKYGERYKAEDYEIAIH